MMQKRAATTTERLVVTYLNNHLAASAGGVQLAWRIARNQRDTPHGATLEKIAAAVAEDRARMRTLMARMDVPERRPGQLLARVGEVAGRLKTNGAAIRRSPLSDLLEVEAMSDAISAKQAGWRALLASDATNDPIIADELRDLEQRAQDQLADLDQIHQEIAARVLTVRF